MKNRFQLVLGSIVISAMTPAAHAAIYWNTTTTGTWANTANWWTTDTGTTNPATPPGSSDAVVFNGAGVNGATIVQLDADAAASGLTFNNTGTTMIENFDVTARTLTLGSGGITVASTADNVTISTGLSLSANQTWGSAKTITIAGTVSGASRSLNKGNGGTVQFATGSNVSLAAITSSGNQDFGLISATGGSLDVSGNIGLGRSNNYSTAPTLAAPVSAVTSSGLYINGAAVSAGSLSIGLGNSSTSVRVDSGSLAVPGKVLVANHNNSTRWSVLQVHSGTFTSSDTTDGIVISPNRGTLTNNGEVYLSGGVSTAEKIAFGAASDTKGGNGFFILGGGTLYLGNGGIVKASTTIDADLYNYTIGLTSGTLGAKDNWVSSLNMTLGTNPTIKAADAANAAKSISLDGTLSGGGFTKAGTGTLTLKGTNTYTGATTVGSGAASGTLAVSSTGAIVGSTLTVKDSSIFTSAGAVALTGATSINGNSSGQNLLSLTGGTFSTISMNIGRGGGGLFTEPTSGYNNAGLYVNGAAATINGLLNINGSDSTATARMDSGSLSASGIVTIGLGNTGRWSVLDINGGIFTSTNTATGVQIGSASSGNALFLVRNGTATVEKITFNKVGTAVLQGVARVNGGTLYIGSQGIVTTGSNADFSTTVKLAGGTLGAKANWTSAADVNVLLSGLPTIQAADSSAAPFDITLAGAISGSAGFTKTGGGKLTLSGANTYTGATTVTLGTLALVGGSQASPITVSSGATLGFTLGSATTSSSTVTFSGATAKVSVSGTPAAATLMTTAVPSGITGTPVLDPAIPGYVLAIEDGGTTLKLKASSGSSYNTWASTNGVPGQAANLDHDNDGVSNGVEYFIGGPVGITTGFTLLPGVTTVGATRSITWVKGPGYTGNYPADFVVETSTTLAAESWSPESFPGTVSISGDNVTYTFPAGPVKTFVRLKVTGP